MSLIKKQWDELAESIFHPGISKLQRAEMEKMFYAGVLVMLELNLQLAELPEAEGSVMLSTVYSEVMNKLSSITGVKIQGLK